MKKQILGMVMIIGTIAIVALNIYSGKNADFVFLTNANIEALANNEGGGSSSSWACWSQEKEGDGYWRCGNPCEFVRGFSGKSTEGKCYK